MTWYPYVLWPCLTAVIWYLGSYATVSEGLWRRYPASLARFMLCPACLGFWLHGALAAGFGWFAGWRPWGLSLIPGVIVSAFLGIFSTPIAGALLMRSLRAIHDATTYTEE